MTDQNLNPINSPFEFRAAMAVQKNLDADALALSALAEQVVAVLKDLPLAPRETPWDALEADKRVREFTKAVEAPNVGYTTAHLFNDSEAEGFAACKGLFCDVVDGRLCIVAKAVEDFAASVAKSAIPDDDRSGIVRKVSALYGRMRREFDDEELAAPWAEKSAVQKWDEDQHPRDEKGRFGEGGGGGKSQEQRQTEAKEASKIANQKSTDAHHFEGKFSDWMAKHKEAEKAHDDAARAHAAAGRD